MIVLEIQYRNIILLLQKFLKEQPQEVLGNTTDRQLTIGYNINSDPNTLLSATMSSSIYNLAGNYNGVNWPADTYRLYSSYANTAFNISNNGTDDLYFKGNTVG